MIKSKLVKDSYGNKYWRLGGLLHREDGPAIEFSNGYREWRINGHLHHVNGPAVIFSNGIEQWWLNGKLYSAKEDWFHELTPEQQYNYLWNLDDDE